MKRQEIIEQLQQRILSLQGNYKHQEATLNLGLGAIETAFPGKSFPLGAIHELISFTPEASSATNGFLAMLLGKLTKERTTCVWISNKRKIYPPALKAFGINPEQILFVDVWKVKDTLWALEEALKCEALTGVVGEIGELSFNDSRRLQLAVEKSNVTGFIHRHQPKNVHPLASVARWKITPIPSVLPGKMPGVGFPQWEIELLKVKNGNPQKWRVQWSPAGLEYLPGDLLSVPKSTLKSA
jgi:protein ImuA